MRYCIVFILTNATIINLCCHKCVDLFLGSCRFFLHLGPCNQTQVTSQEIIPFFIRPPLCTTTTTVHITGYLFLHLTPILRWRPSRVRRVGNTIRSNWGNTFPVQMIKFFGQFVPNRRTRYFFCTRYKSSSWASLLEPCFWHFCWKKRIFYWEIVVERFEMDHFEKVDHQFVSSSALGLDMKYPNISPLWWTAGQSSHLWLFGFCILFKN